MTRLWQCGWEANSLTAGVEITSALGTAPPTVVTSPVRTGTYAMRANPSSDAALVTYTVYSANQSIVGYQRVYVRIATAPGGGETPQVLRFVNSSSSTTSAIVLNNNRKFDLYDSSLAKVGTVSSPALPLNTWAMVELSQDSSVNPSVLTARYNGTVFATGSNAAQSPWSRIHCGAAGTSSCDLYLDDWAINDSTGTTQNSWPGEGNIIHLKTNATGDANQWNQTGNTPGTTGNFALLADVPPDDATNMVQSGTSGNIDMYNVGASGLHADDTVSAVLVGARFANNTADATTAFRIRAEKTASGTVSESASIIPNSTTWVTNNKAGTGGIFPLALLLDPDGNPWTQATLDTMQVGLNLTAAGTNRIQVTSVWASVDYVTSPPGKVVQKAQAVNRSARY